MKKLFSFVMFMFVVAVMMFASSCGNSSNEIVIGVSGPLTGGAAVYGQAVANSAQMAVDEINDANGGINGYKLKLVAVDDMHDASKISTNYATLLKNNMKVSLGTVTTKPGLEFKELSKDDNVFFMTPSATADAIPEYKNGYQMCFADTRQGTFTANYLNDNVEAQKVGVLYRSGDDYSEGIYNNFMKNINKDKFTEIVVASFSEDEPTDLSSQVALLKDCTFIFLPIYYTPASTFMTQAKGTVSNDAVYFGCDGLDGIDTAIEGFDIKTIPQEVSYLSHFNAKSEAKATADYVKKYTERFGVETLNQFGASAYDCVYAIYNALLEVEKANPGYVTPKVNASDLCDKLIAVMNGGFTYSGVTGTNISWDNGGFVNKAAGSYVVKQKDSDK